MSLADVGALLSELSKIVCLVNLSPEKEKTVRELAVELAKLLDANTVIAH
jgi:hypothetical protein